MSCNMISRRRPVAALEKCRCAMASDNQAAGSDYANTEDRFFPLIRLNDGHHEDRERSSRNGLRWRRGQRHWQGENEMEKQVGRDRRRDDLKIAQERETTIQPINDRLHGPAERNALPFQSTTTGKMNISKSNTANWNQKILEINKRRRRRRSNLSVGAAAFSQWLLLVAATLVALCLIPFDGTLRTPLINKQVSCQTISAAAAAAADQLVAESRAETALGPSNLLHKQPNTLALNQLVNFLNSINNNNNNQNNNQQARNDNQQQQQQRRSPQIQPLPLGTMGNQRAGLPQAISSSTPVNPFAAAAQFQPTRRQQFPQNNNNNNFLAASSSSPPPTPLTLNRIAASNPFNGMQANPQRFNNNNIPPQPLNTIPLGSFASSSSSSSPNGFNQQRPSLPLAPQRGAVNNNLGNQMQANRQQQQQFQPPPPPPSLRSPLMPPPHQQHQQQHQFQQMNGQQPPRPIITGFAPSGPPPSSANNNAINVVQSPPNAIGQPSSSPPTPANVAQHEPSSSPPAGSTSQAEFASRVPPTSQLPITTIREATSTTTTPTTTTTTTTTASSTSTSAAETNLAASSESAPTLISTSSGEPNPSSSTSSSTQPETTATGGGGGETSITPSNAWNAINNQTTTSRQQQQQQPPISLAPTPDIVTVPPGYDPNQPQPAGPQSYDIAVSAQMGPSQGASSTPNLQAAADSVEPQRSVGPTSGGQSSFQSAESAVEPTPALTIVPQPTETTTIIWSSEPPISTSSMAPMAGRPSAHITPTRTQQQPTATSTAATTQVASSTPPNRIRDNSMALQNDDPSTTTTTTSGEPAAADQSVVYGKAPSREAKPTRPPPPPPGQGGEQSGRGFIRTAPLDAQVRPYSAGTQPLLKSNNHGGGPSGLPFKPSRPLNGASPTGSGSGSGMSVGSGFTIVASGNQTMPTGDIQDYVANAPPAIVSSSSSSSANNNAEPTISAQGGPDPANFDLAPEASSSSRQESQQQQTGSSSSSTTAAPRLRRPTFKPKPAVPPIRIDSCIVGDDSSCDQSHNERCVTEYGISSCHCKPGYARLSQLRGYCSPISLLQFNLKIERLSDDRKLVFNQTLENPNSEEYQFLEFETIQALASALQQTPLAKQFMGAKVNKFYDRKQRVWANVSINLEASNLTRSERVQQVAGQELAKLVQARRNQPLGESTLVLDGSKESVSKLVDVNECASKDLNDCSKHATCTNEFGGYSCQCLPGYEDKLLAQQQQQQQASAAADNSSPANGAQQQQQQQLDKSKAGRVCMGCSQAYCSNRGECSIQEGRKQCKCRPNFMGARCDIDSEVLFVAIGGSLVGLIILIITFWCLFVFNRRWRREQQKMDAMSATSGLTYNYVNSSSNSSNSLMSPTRTVAAGPLLGGGGGGGGRSSTAAAYAAMNQRRSSHFGSGATDQQAIIGSTTSSGSSAASQPIACNPYAAGYQYEDAGLLIAPASTGSSEQTSPGASSYRGHHHHHQHHSNYLAASAAAGNAYTLSGHHHHHHHQLNHQQQQQQHFLHHTNAHMHQQQHHQANKQHQLVSQFHPALDYSRTLNAANYHQPQQQQLIANGYDTRWRTLQQHDGSGNGKQQLAGYYLVR